MFPMHRKTKSKEDDAIRAAARGMYSSFDAYARLYPDLIPRIREIMASNIPAIRDKVELLRKAIAREGDARQASLARRYGLTPAQARIAVFIADGGSVASYAKENKISAQTVRTHLKAVFAKTGISRQTQLATILAGARALTKD